MLVILWIQDSLNRGLGASGESDGEGGLGASPQEKFQLFDG